MYTVLGISKSKYVFLKRGIVEETNVIITLLVVHCIHFQKIARLVAFVIQCTQLFKLHFVFYKQSSRV